MILQLFSLYINFITLVNTGIYAVATFCCSYNTWHTQLVEHLTETKHKHNFSCLYATNIIIQLVYLMFRTNSIVVFLYQCFDPYKSQIVFRAKPITEANRYKHCHSIRLPQLLASHRRRSTICTRWNVSIKLLQWSLSTIIYLLVLAHQIRVLKSYHTKQRSTNK